jgi:trk system potassium uptake protein TrkH
LFIRRKEFNVYFEDLEFRILIILSVLSTLVILPKLALFYGSNVVGLEYAFFHVVSAFTCGGFAVSGVNVIFSWPDFVKVILVLLMIIGGSAGSTAGGIKISRAWLFVKSIYWRIKALILPKGAFFPKRFEARIVQDSEIMEISQFILLYAIFILFGALILTALGYDLGNALFEVASAQSNVGISTGITHAGMNAVAEVMLIINMWIGRLEIMPIMATIGFALSMRRRTPKVV